MSREADKAGVRAKIHAILSCGYNLDLANVVAKVARDSGQSQSFVFDELKDMEDDDVVSIIPSVPEKVHLRKREHGHCE